MNNELSSRSSKRKRKKISEIELVIKEANTLYIKNDLDQCIIKARDVLSKAPRCDRAYFLLGLVFEEKKDIIKAYNFYMIAAQLMKNNYDLWYKLYTLSSDLCLYSDKLYFIQIIQRHRNTRSLVVEKMELFKMLKNKYKALECKIELFEFDGIDFEIFDKIRNETKHKLRRSILATYLIKYYKKNVKACGIEYLIDCIRLQYESGYLIGTRDLLESEVFPRLPQIPNDIRIIYIVSCLGSIKSNRDESLFKNSYNENEIETDGYLKKGELNYKNISEKIFSITESIFGDLNIQETVSKTLKLDDIDRCTYSGSEVSQAIPVISYEHYADINLLLSDEEFWSRFKEDEEVKPFVEVLIDLKMLGEATKLINRLLEVSQNLQEFCNYKLGEINDLLGDTNMASVYFEKALKVNPDNVSVKSKLFDIYSKLGNTDMSSYYRTVNSLIKYVDDTSNKEKKDYRFSFEDCQHFRDLFYESKRMFEIDFKSHIKVTKTLVEDFLKNEFIFIQNSKFKNFLSVEDRKKDSLKEYNLSLYDCDKKMKIIENVRHLSLHGLDTDEWFCVLLEYIVSKIENRNYSEASFLLRRCLDAHLFTKRRDIMTTFFLLSIKHSLHNNDFLLLTYSFKKLISIFGNYNLSHYFFYLCNFFIEPHLKPTWGKLLRNIRRYYFRSHIAKRSSDIEDLNDEVSNSSAGSTNGCEVTKDLVLPNKYKVDPLCFMNTYLNKTVFSKTYKVLEEIKGPLTINEELLKSLICVLACKSRNNNEKNTIIKMALSRLGELCKRSTGDYKYAIIYNIGKVYDMLGYMGYAERYYKVALKTSNRELKRMALFNLILIYKKNGNSILMEKYYKEDV